VRERVIEGTERVRPSDLEVEVVADSLVADGDLYTVARAIPEKHDFQSIRRSFGELDPIGMSRGVHGLLLFTLSRG
jgi:hypothetical protein